MKRYFKFKRSFTNKQLLILKELKKRPETRSELIKNIPDLKSQIIYTYVRRLKKEGTIIEKNKILELSGKAYYYIE
jgi:predicted transcriptional regulator